MNTTQTLTWFGGHAGVMWNADRNLHLIERDGRTFCGVRDGLRPVTAREANSDACRWCESCFQRARQGSAA